MFLSAFCWW